MTIDPALMDPGIKAPATYAEACASVAEGAIVTSTLLFAKILELEIAQEYGAPEPVQSVDFIVTVADWSVISSKLLLYEQVYLLLLFLAVVGVFYI